MGRVVEPVHHGPELVRQPATETKGTVSGTRIANGGGGGGGGRSVASPAPSSDTVPQIRTVAAFTAEVQRSFALANHEPISPQPLQ